MCSSSKDKINVTRILLYEGNRKWIENVLTKSYISPEQALLTPNGSITEVSRVIKEVKDEES